MFLSFSLTVDTLVGNAVHTAVLWEVGICVQTDGQTDKHTKRQTDTLITILRSPSGGGVNSAYIQMLQ